MIDPRVRSRSFATLGFAVELLRSSKLYRRVHLEKIATSKSSSLASQLRRSSTAQPRVANVCERTLGCVSKRFHRKLLPMEPLRGSRGFGDVRSQGALTFVRDPGLRCATPLEFQGFTTAWVAMRPIGIMPTQSRGHGTHFPPLSLAKSTRSLRVDSFSRFGHNRAECSSRTCRHGSRHDFNFRIAFRMAAARLGGNLNPGIGGGPYCLSRLVLRAQSRAG